MLQAVERRTLVALIVALSACTAETAPVDVSGECTDAFGAQLCTWARLDGSKVVEAGATVPLASRSGTRP
jgi:uncharacterized protein YcgI (DUF1989 family)